MKSPSYKILRQGWLTFLFHESLVPPCCPWNFKFTVDISRYIQYFSFFALFIYVLIWMPTTLWKNVQNLASEQMPFMYIKKGKEENASLNTRKIHQRSVLYPDLPHYSGAITHLFYFSLAMAILLPDISLYFLHAFRFELKTDK